MKERALNKRIISGLVVIVMLLSILPIQVYAAHYVYNASRNPATITLQSSSGTRIEGAEISVTYSSNTYEVVEEGRGVYKFSRYSSSYSRQFTIAVMAAGYENANVTMRGNRSSISITLEEKEVESAVFNVYYTADGHIPDNGYQAANDAADYGPSADNTPLTTIKVNLTKLKEIASQANSPVVYGEGSLASRNQYEFVPAGSHTDADYLEKVEAFWNAVLSCVDEASITAFEETGLFDEYMAYCLKKQGDGSQHADGILNVTPPVYIVELYQNEVFFGGGVTDSAENSVFLTAYDILDQYEAHLKQTITWVQDERGKPKLNDQGQYTGTYVDPATNKIHNIAVFQTNAENAVAVEGSEIPYTKQTKTYYLAQFNMSVDAGVTIRYLITYTDGVDNEAVFNEHEYAAQRNEVVPAYTGVTIRDGYKFIGWHLEGTSDSTLYSDADIAKMTVSRNMTFHAVWELIPRYTGTVTVVVNGSYDAASQSLTSGTLTDIEVPLKLDGDATVYLTADEKEYVALTKQSTGVYSAMLESGVYSIYYSQGGGNSFVKITDQPLIIENMDRTRYLFYNTVYHDLNGGNIGGSTENTLEYFHAGDRVVSGHEQNPVREGYEFTGWLTNDGRLLGTGDVVTESIDRAYTVTAQWIKLADVYAHIKIDHYNAEGDAFDVDNAKHDIFFTIDTRKAGETGDFTEIYQNTIVWDGESDYTDNHYDYAYIASGGSNYTSYTAHTPNLAGVPADAEYTITANKSGYIFKNVYTETDENGDIHIYAELQFDPDEFDFTYSVVLDEEAKKLDKSLWPVAVNVKVTSYYEGAWHHINEHTSAYDRVALDENGEGTSFYPVWAQESDNGGKYYYRIEVVSYEMKDGTIVPANSTDGVHFDAIDKSYLSEVVITGGQAPSGADLEGVWYNDAQQGTAQAIVSIPVYTVTFIPNGGTLNGSFANKVLEDQIVMPNLSAYIPERDGGYIFEGWYVYENGHMTDTAAVSGSELTSDVTLIAKWRDPISVEGMVTVAATYEQQNEDGSVTVQYIHEVDRAKSVRILLQKKMPTGYYETVDWRELWLDYGNEYYYFRKPSGLKVPVGYGYYSFMGIADDGSEYRIYVLSPNYTTTFQNEPESVTNSMAYNTYTETDYDALVGTVRPEVATVNGHLHFAPPSFDLNYKVDATAIGEGYRPDGAEVVITYDDSYAVYQPWKWTAISQMVFGNEIRGNMESLTDGIANGSYPVWKYTYDGATLYDYGMNIKSTVKDGVSTEFEQNPYFYIEYQAPAHFDSQTNGQSQLLVATLKPYTYNINYETNGGIIFGSYTKNHTWSYQTELSQVVPVKEGYSFAGWYTDSELTKPLTDKVIPASATGDVTYYAKWIQVMDSVNVEMTIDHSTNDDGLANTFDGDLTVTLARKVRGSEDNFIQITGQDVVYDSSVWNSADKVHTMSEDGVFTGLSAEYDYNLFVNVDGYFVDPEKSYVQKVTAEDGSTQHNVVIYLKYNPELVNLSFTVEMEEGTDENLYPLNAQVKVLSWYDTPHDDAEKTDWFIITQHNSKVVDVAIDWESGKGQGSYPVWQWADGEKEIPYFYRIEVVSLELADGTVIPLTEKQYKAQYVGGGYSADIYAENGVMVPSQDTELAGAYGASAKATDTTVFNYTQVGTLKAVISAPSVVLHANNKEASCYDELTGEDVFRTYLAPAAHLPYGEYYNLESDNTLPEFYDIPTFDYNTHNEYIFKGWYDGVGEDAKPVDYNTVFEGQTHLYAHWILSESVQKEDDGKTTGVDSYKGYDLVGAQIRDKEADSGNYYGTVGSGLRFITVLSEDVYSQINAIVGNEPGAEYGFAISKASTADQYATGDGYTLQYNGKNVNGIDTTADYKYVKNMRCSGVEDHYNGKNYRLYTAVITYKGLEGDALEAAYATPFVARSYIRYYDANGLYRTYYNNYTGTQRFSSINTSFASVRDVVTGGEG